jgi:hypothetical protein
MTGKHPQLGPGGEDVQSVEMTVLALEVSDTGKYVLVPKKVKVVSIEDADITAGADSPQQYQVFAFDGTNFANDWVRAHA